MFNFKGYLYALLFVVVLHILDRYLPKWFGALPGVVYLVFILYKMFTQGFTLPMFLVLIGGEVILNGIWFEAIEARNKKTKKELEKMKAKDISSKSL
ncbi:hypothetical protein FC19_GL000128 [Liquorilactobacillus aquaticus DSM 21051]|uniref:Integral membrane protein n=1 Tax=Liquorilactobacillus aquaticus DSM 21051 TaxID=1423725 RepID=A0A0R2CTY2_9LACO|nr:hypothetical protein [Liquorilactobacillus aquaticus]KRM94869.1 hypothetical protein FC19_GL000128 [Liquorilactobacillus aquaticus DSM 21051]